MKQSERTLSVLNEMKKNYEVMKQLELFNIMKILEFRIELMTLRYEREKSHGE